MIAVALWIGGIAPSQDIDSNPYALAAYAELLASLGEIDRARACLDRALAHQPSRIQRALLERKRAALLR